MAIKKLHDPHTRFSMPCCSPFIFVLPYTFKFTPDTNNQIKCTFDESLVGGLTKLYEDEKNFDLKNKEIRHIYLGDNYEEEEKPEETIARWAEDNNPLSRSTAGQTNGAIMTYFFMRPASAFRIPTTNITVGYINDGKEVNVTLDYCTYLGDSVSNADSLCKLRSSKSSSLSSFQNKMNFEGEEKKNIILKEKEKKEKKGLFNKIKSFFKINKHKRLSPSEFDELLRNDFLPPGIEHSPVDEMNKEIDRIVTLSGKGKKEENERINRKSNADNDYEAVNPNNDIVGYIQKSKKRAILYIPSFSPTESIEKAMQTFYLTLRKAKQNNYDKLVINLVGNGGGAVVLMQSLIYLLWPHVYPQYYEHIIAESKSTTFLLKEMYVNTTSTYSTYINNFTYYDLSKESTVPITVTGTIDEKEVSRKRNWFPRYRLQSVPYLHAYLTESRIGSEIFNKTLFTSEQIVIITDGQCASACSLFTKFALENHLAKVVGIGGDPRDGAIDYDVGSATSGPVMNAETTLSYMEQYKYDTDLLHFPRESADMSYTTSAAFSLLKGEEDLMMEYKHMKPHKVLNTVYPNYRTSSNKETVFSLSDQVDDVFNMCMDGDIEIVSSCTKPTDGSAAIENGVYGHPCVNDAYDDNQCVLAGCTEGYYLNNSQCQVFPDIPYYDLSGNLPEFPPYAYVIIGIGLIIIAIIAFFIYCCCIRKKKNTSNDDQQKVELQSVQVADNN